MPLLKTKKKSMTMLQVQKKAKKLDISPGKMKKTELIHAIQQAENCTPCYSTSDGNCQYTDCCFMVDCVKS